MATSNDLLFEQRPVIEFMAAERCSAANIHSRMKTVYGEMCISDCAVRKWTSLDSTQLLERYSTEGQAFQQSILIGDECWVHH
ncbi:transposase [Elysia marginata]|uniref:Transposase n=1 Tax=Elysia marginata TaxID=1093978 RepID=A0AAV4IQJ5_9GAST|nr:transposase [Elysia marginata]